jgi:hypothetical protein
MRRLTHLVNVLGHPCSLSRVVAESNGLEQELSLFELILLGQRSSLELESVWLDSSRRRVGENVNLGFGWNGRHF